VTWVACFNPDIELSRHTWWIYFPRLITWKASST